MRQWRRQERRKEGWVGAVCGCDRAKVYLLDMRTTDEPHQVETTIFQSFDQCV